MSDSIVTLNINGREALPVRAIPFVVEMSADLVAKELAGDAPPPWKRLDGLTAYHVQQGQPSSMQPFEWRRYVASLEELEAEIRDRFPKEESPNDPRGYGAWKRESVAQLPAGVFVWRNEFEAAWVDLPEGRTVSRSLTFTPQLSDGERQLILEGFKVEDRPARGGEMNNGLFPYSYIEMALEEDPMFPGEALIELEKIERHHKLKSTYTTASSASALLLHWLTMRELKRYVRGREVDDVAEATVNLDRLEDGMAAIEDSWLISIVELMRLIQSKGMTFPQALCADAGMTPEDDLPNEIGYTIRGAALALSEKYGIAYDAIHKAILNAARQGRLEMLDPRSGMPWDFDGRDFNQRIRIKDLNEWFKESGVEYRLGDGNSDASRMGTPMKKKALLDLLRGYPELPNAMQANDPEFIACRVPPERAPGKKGGYYYMEEVERVCESRWGKKNIPPTSSSPSFPFSQAARGMKDGKKFG